MHLDHHLQQKIIAKFLANETPLSFSELKQSDTDNSLFSYHLKKLIAQGMIEKQSNGYTLTVDGARWINTNNNSLTAPDTLRAYVALVIKDDQDNYLVGERTGQLKTKINDYMLPTVPLNNDQLLQDQVSDACELFVPQGHSRNNVQEYGIVQISARYSNKTMNALFLLHSLNATHYEPRLIEGIDFTWRTLSSIDTIDHPSARILSQLIRYTHNPQHSHTTPIIIG